MSLVRKIFYVSVLVLAISVAVKEYKNFKVKENFLKLEKWAEQNKIEIDRSKIKSKEFKIKFDEKEWNLLKQKLELTRYFEPLTDVPRFDYGFDPEYSKELVDYWKTKFDWKLKVDYLNKYPQFKININDTIIHYVHFVTNKNIPNLKKVNLLLIDGWPGSFFGFYKMIDYINENFKDVSYDIIVPSIPGYGYSSPVNKVVDPVDTAVLLDALMRYEHGEDVEFYMHGEDWGSVVTTYVAKLFPKRCRAIHITMPPLTSFLDLESMFYAFLGQISPNFILTPEEIKNNFKYNLSVLYWLLVKKTGYFHLQATKPDSLGAGLTDSPVGLMAYVLEKYSLGSFNFQDEVRGKMNGNLDKFDRDDLLTIITYYWMTNTITSSMRLYRNTFYKIDTWPRNDIGAYKISSQVPVAVQYFKNEVSTIPLSMLKLKYENLTRFNIAEKGGHFCAFENPAESARDFISFLKSL